mgnify:CR=1 FL=1
MLGISLTEFAVIICAAVILIKPEDMPVIIKVAKSFLKRITALKKEYSSTIHKLQKEFDLDEEESKTIIDANGKPYIAYDIEDLKSEQLPQKNKNASKA